MANNFDFQFIYEHSARGAAQSNPDYRYAYLPDDIDLSNPAKNDVYKQAVVTMPGVGVPGADASVDVQATRVVWGLTVMKVAPNPESAMRFLQLLFAPGDIGQSTLQNVGPAPISPPVVSAADSDQLPPELRNLVTTADPLGT